MAEKLDSFTFEGTTLRAEYVETLQVTDGVECDVYIHPETQKRDLGIIRIQRGKKTPLQRVVLGDETIEGLLEGRGTLTITHANGMQTVMEVDSTEGEGFSYSVLKDELMQWQAAEDSDLVAFEICYPPWTEGRFENVEERTA